MSKQIKIIFDADCVNRFNSIYFQEHPRAKKPRIKSPQHPSLNEYYKKSFQAANAMKQNWKDFVVWRVNELGLCNKNIQKCCIKYNTYFKTNRRHDLDNISPKFILDGFVEAGLLEDDDSSHIESLTTVCSIDKENPRIEFIITIL